MCFISGDLNVTIANDQSPEVPFKLTDNEDGTYVVDYSPPTPGNYTVSLKYGGLQVPQSPIRVPVHPHVDVSKIKVDGLEPSKFGRTILTFL